MFNRMLTLGAWKKWKRRMQTTAIHALSEDLKLYKVVGEMQERLEKQGLGERISGVPIPTNKKGE